MKARTVLVGALSSLLIVAPLHAATKQSPMGIALGNLLIGDYGSQGKVTAAFDPDGTVALTFPDGTKRTQAWVADANYFCMIVTPGADGKMNYRCERNLIAGKKLNEVWQQVDSEGLPVAISVQPRP